MKSMLMSSHFQEGMGKGWRVPAVFRWLALILEHVSHSKTYFAMSTFMLGHQKFLSNLGTFYYSQGELRIWRDEPHPKFSS
jgi:hypothetical protein